MILGGLGKNSNVTCGLPPDSATETILTTTKTTTTSTLEYKFAIHGNLGINISLSVQKHFLNVLMICHRNGTHKIKETPLSFLFLIETEKR